MYLVVRNSKKELVEFVEVNDETISAVRLRLQFEHGPYVSIKQEAKIPVEKKLNWRAK